MLIRGIYYFKTFLEEIFINKFPLDVPKRLKMFESLISIKKAERAPWELFFIGLLYASVSLLLVDFIFLRDAVLSEYASILIVTFTVIFCIPFFYYLIKNEEEKDIKTKRKKIGIKEHSKALSALTYLFLGLLVAFSVWYIILPESMTEKNFSAQIGTYCKINHPAEFEICVNSSGLINQEEGYSLSSDKAFERIINIFANNFSVLIFVLIFSLMFGAGSIFILAWNASVIAVAVGVFAKGEFLNLSSSFLRYLIHGIPEIAAYFTVALAGGILSVAIIRHNFGEEKFWKVIKDSINMFLLSLIILLAAALIEVLFVPMLF
jgi:uncharacterized membrane protein SpoIIM required for sporulation